MLATAFEGWSPDIRLLLRQTVSTESDHARGIRIAFDDLLAITEIDASQLAAPLRETVVLFDDVLTTGKHFKVCLRKIREVRPNVPVVGVFVARRVFPEPLEDV